MKNKQQILIYFLLLKFVIKIIAILDVFLDFFHLLNNL